MSDQIPVSAGVRVTVVASEGEAEIVCGMLRSEGIRCAYRTTNMSADSGLDVGGWREVLVAAADEVQARTVLAAIK